MSPPEAQAVLSCPSLPSQSAGQQSFKPSVPGWNWINGSKQSYLDSINYVPPPPPQPPHKSVCVGGAVGVIVLFTEGVCGRGGGHNSHCSRCVWDGGGGHNSLYSRCVGWREGHNCLTACFPPHPPPPFLYACFIALLLHDNNLAYILLPCYCLTTTWPTSCCPATA